MKKIHFEWTFSFAIGLTVLSLTIAIATQHWVVKNYRINGSQKSFDAIVDALDQLLKDTPQQELFESKIYFYLKQLERVGEVYSLFEVLFSCFDNEHGIDITSEEVIYLLRDRTFSDNRIQEKIKCWCNDYDINVSRNEDEDEENVSHEKKNNSEAEAIEEPLIKKERLSQKKRTQNNRSRRRK